MLDTTIFEVKRQANVSRSEALGGLLEKYPAADVLSFKKQGSFFVAKIRVAGDDEEVVNEEPKKAPPAAESDDSEDSGSEDAGPPSDDSGDSDSGGPDLGGDDLGGGDDMGGEKKAPEEETVDLLRQILHALQGGAGPAGGAHHGPPEAGLELPDVGAPTPGGGPGGGLPPHGGPGGPAGGGAPLPPAVPPKRPGMPGAFANRRSMVVIRDDAHELTPRSAATEARDNFPGFKVTAMDHDKTNNQYRVTLVRE